MHFGRGEKQQEPASSGAQEFSAKGSRIEPQLIHVVDFAGGDIAAEVAFGEPGAVKEVAEFAQGAVAGENIETFVHHFTHLAQERTVLIDAAELGFQDFRGFAGDTGKDQVKMGFEFLKTGWADGDAMNVNILLCSELDEVESAESREDLILAADPVAQEIAFDVNGFISQFGRAKEFPFKAVERVEERDGEGGGGTEAGEGGQIRHGVQFDVLFETAELEAFAINVMLDILDASGEFHLSIRDANGIIEQMTEKWAGGGVGILVDGGGENRAPFLQEIFRIIRSPAEETDAHRGPRDDHRGLEKIWVPAHESIRQSQ